MLIETLRKIYQDQLVVFPHAAKAIGAPVAAEVIKGQCG